jgi:hypothetical protein
MNRVARHQDEQHTTAKVERVYDYELDEAREAFQRSPPGRLQARHSNRLITSPLDGSLAETLGQPMIGKPILNLGRREPKRTITTVH